MNRHYRTRQAMHLSRGLLLGRMLTGLRHLCLGGCALSIGTLAITGHVTTAIGMVVGLYLLCKAWDALQTRIITGRRG